MRGRLGHGFLYLLVVEFAALGQQLEPFGLIL